MLGRNACASTRPQRVQYSGTVRGRFGYASDHWLVYASGGLAWTYNQFSREQLVGPPAARSAVPGSVESFFLVPRVGWAAGGGVEFLLASNFYWRRTGLLALNTSSQSPPKETYYFALPRVLFG
jgi:opacity protein-like surface antigen